MSRVLGCGSGDLNFRMGSATYYLCDLTQILFDLSVLTYFQGQRLVEMTSSLIVLKAHDSVHYIAICNMVLFPLFVHVPSSNLTEYL